MNSQFRPQNATMPQSIYTDSNPDMADEISQSPVFSALADQLKQERDMSAMRYSYIYTLNDEVAGQVTSPFTLTIEQGSDFKCEWITGSAFSYDADVADATSFPIPNDGASLAWAGRGLSLQITDTRTGRELTSGFVPWECMFTPGYGLNFQYPYPFRYLFQRNTKIRFDIRNRDVAARTHEFSINLLGHKILTPQ